MKKIKMISLFFLLWSCSQNKKEKIEQTRWKSIPEAAFWVGGSDGGNWYYIEDIHDHKNNAIIKIYNDKDGSLIISKRFNLICPSDNQTLLKNWKEQILSFDGEKIYLKSDPKKAGCYLQ